MPRDNILLITTDQQRFDTLNAWGNKSIFTPHLNYMAAMGISFTNCYASCPICVPSRTTIMTGRQGFESGVVSNETHESFMRQCTEERTTLPAVLTDAGYQTCAKGKMHFEPARAHYGFEHMRLPLDYMRDYDKKQNLARPKVHGIGECEMEPVISTVDVKDSITTWIADEAIDFLETRDTTRPFFLWTSFTKLIRLLIPAVISGNYMIKSLCPLRLPATGLKPLKPLLRDSLQELMKTRICIFSEMNKNWHPDAHTMPALHRLTMSSDVSSAP